MTSLERRLLALESEAGTPTDAMTIVRTVYAPGEQAEPVRVRTPDGGQEWHRLGNETFDELVERASAEVERTAQGAAALVFW